MKQLYIILMLSTLLFTACAGGDDGEEPLLIEHHVCVPASITPQVSQAFRAMARVWNDTILHSGVREIPADRFDFRTAAGHELGHMLGVPHVHHLEALMRESLFPGRATRGLDAADMDALPVDDYSITVERLASWEDWRRCTTRVENDPTVALCVYRLPASVIACNMTRTDWYYGATVGAPI